MNEFNPESGHSVGEDYFVWDCGCYAVAHGTGNEMIVVSCSAEHDDALLDTLHGTLDDLDIPIVVTPEQHPRWN